MKSIKMSVAFVSLFICQIACAQDDVDQPSTPTTVTAAYSVVDSNGRLIEVATSGLSAFPGGDLNYLRDPSVVKDLELVEDQISKIADIRKRFQEQIRDRSRKDDSAASIKELQKQLHQEISETLLPHQHQRLKQIGYQFQVKRYGGPTNALRQGPIGDELKLTAAQKKELAEIQQQMYDEITAKYKEIQAEAKEKTLKVLTAEQRKQFEEITGEELKIQPGDRQTQGGSTRYRQSSQKD